MKFGVSTSCFYPDVLENSAKFVSELKFPYTEVFFNSFSELHKDYVLKLKETLGDTKALSVHPFTSGVEPFMLFSDYQRRADDMIEFYKTYFEACNLLGADILVLHGDRRESVCPDDRYFERYLKLFETGKSFGVTVSQENVARCKSGSLDFLLKMKKALGDNVKFTLDLKQARRTGCEPLDYLKTLKNDICHVHISDGDLLNECLLIGEGSQDFAEFFKVLREADYKGGVLLELYRRNYKTYSDLYESYEKLLKF